MRQLREVRTVIKSNFYKRTSSRNYHTDSGNKITLQTKITLKGALSKKIVTEFFIRLNFEEKEWCVLPALFLINVLQLLMQENIMQVISNLSPQKTTNYDASKTVVAVVEYVARALLFTHCYFISPSVLP